MIKTKANIEHHEVQVALEGTIETICVETMMLLAGIYTSVSKNGSPLDAKILRKSLIKGVLDEEFWSTLSTSQTVFRIR